MAHAAVISRGIKEQRESTPCFRRTVETLRCRGPFSRGHRLYWRRRVGGGGKHRDIFHHRTDVGLTQAPFPGGHGGAGYAFARDTIQVILRQITSAQTGPAPSGAAYAVTVAYGTILREDRLAARDH